MQNDVGIPIRAAGKDPDFLLVIVKCRERGKAFVFQIVRLPQQEFTHVALEQVFGFRRERFARHFGIPTVRPPVAVRRHVVGDRVRKVVRKPPIGDAGFRLGVFNTGDPLDGFSRDAVGFHQPVFRDADRCLFNADLYADIGVVGKMLFPHIQGIIPKLVPDHRVRQAVLRFAVL